jgi:hypothetical protein
MYYKQTNSYVDSRYRVEMEIGIAFVYQMQHLADWFIERQGRSRGGLYGIGACR